MPRWFKDSGLKQRREQCRCHPFPRRGGVALGHFPFVHFGVGSTLESKRLRLRHHCKSMNCDFVFVNRVSFVLKSIICRSSAHVLLTFDCATDSRPLVLAVARPLLRPLRTPSRRGRPAGPGLGWIKKGGARSGCRVVQRQWIETKTGTM